MTLGLMQVANLPIFVANYISLKTVNSAMEYNIRRRAFPNTFLKISLITSTLFSLVMATSPTQGCKAHESQFTSQCFIDQKHPECCINGAWNCSSLPHNNPEKCKSGMVYDHELDICYQIIPDVTHTMPCLKIYNYNYLRLMEGKRVWGPAQRQGLDYFRWTTVDKNYGREFIFDSYKNDDFTLNDCVVYDISSYLMVPCTQLNAALCTEYPYTICGNTDFHFYDSIVDFCYNNSICFCKNFFAFVSFVLQPYSNRNVSNDCVIYIQKSQNRYVISLKAYSDNQTIYMRTNSATNKVFYVALSSEDLNVLLDDTINCTINVVNNSSSVKLQLEYNSESGKIHLNLSNTDNFKPVDAGKNCVYCFSNADNSSLIESFDWCDGVGEKKSQNGYYQCIGFNYDLEAIRSNVLKVERIVQFVSILEVKYAPNVFPLTSKMYDVINQALKMSLPKHDVSVNIFAINRINVNERLLGLTLYWYFKEDITIDNLIETYYILKSILLVLKFSNFVDYDGARVESITLIQDLLVTQFCLEETVNMSGVNFSWKTTPLHMSALSSPLCFGRDSGDLISRRCKGDSINGARWSAIQENCSPLTSISDALIKLITSNQTADALLEALNEITNQYSDFVASDIELTSEILKEVSAEVDLDLNVMSSIISNLQLVSQDVLQESQNKFNSTDSILYSLDLISKNSIYIGDYNESNYFFLLVIDLKEQPLTGIVIQKDNSTNITKLEGPINYGSLGIIENFEAAIIFNDTLIAQIIHDVDDPTLIVSVFLTDALFNEEGSTRKNLTKILFNVLIPNFETAFVTPISIIYKSDRHGVIDRDCVYWKYGIVGDNPVKGSWENDGNTKESSTFKICEHTHVTHFGMLIDNSNHVGDDSDSTLLDMITYINCGLSLTGLLGILQTAMFYKRWRHNTGNVILIHFVLAVLLQIVLFFVSSVIFDTKSNSMSCTIVGILLHYSVVSQFCWMLVIAILEFKRFVEVLSRPPKFILAKACLCGWIMPVIPVICIISLDPNNYTSGSLGLCYPSKLGLYLGVWLPVAIIVIINLVIFGYIMYNIFHRKPEYVDTGSCEIIFQWRLGFLLFFMLGISWIFAFLGQLGLGIIFDYLFCFTATLQGFVMFLFFILFNKRTRMMYVNSIRGFKKL